ncbi:hypothetical protein ZWY2020_038926 [Hordeum vulgare]|nr:hypothetical protein ZWY2020_038926 [Hordeum vulgare]
MTWRASRRHAAAPPHRALLSSAAPELPLEAQGIRLSPRCSSLAKLNEWLFNFVESLVVTFRESLVVAMAFGKLLPAAWACGQSSYLLHGELVSAASFLVCHRAGHGDGQIHACSSRFDLV